MQGYHPHKIICIGDGKADIQMARHYPNGIGILVWTNSDDGEFEDVKPDCEADTLVDVVDILKKA